MNIFLIHMNTHVNDLNKGVIIYILSLRTEYFLSVKEQIAKRSPTICLFYVRHPCVFPFDIQEC